MQATHPGTLAGRLVGRSAAATIAAVVGFAALTAVLAQVRLYLPGNPVPITGQTFAVLLAGAALGSWAGAGSQLLYVAVGMAGLPVFAGANGGWTYATGATFGYLAGFVAAAWLVGRLAEQGQDRSVWTAIPAFLTGTAVIYTLGVVWLMWTVPGIDSIARAVTVGVVPFLAGDALKIALAGVALPTAWRLTGGI